MSPLQLPRGLSPSTSTTTSTLPRESPVPTPCRRNTQDSNCVTPPAGRRPRFKVPAAGLAEDVHTLEEARRER
ncbi:hypothetical protein EDB89DRAFT_2069252 [Lactarius sanguifluus]|nr:hypothetical protein EDB89DRAFT_2069252 [Lactarius sanguifluus]